MLLPLLVTLIAGVAGCALLAAQYGERRWAARTLDLLAQLEASSKAGEEGCKVGSGGTVPSSVSIYSASRDLVGLPPCVRRYFLAALRDGQPLLRGARVTHQGTFNLSAAYGTEQWRPFSSQQRILLGPAGAFGFIWDARIRMAPGLSVRVHDAYLCGDGLLHGALLGLLPLFSDRDELAGKLAAGELMRFAAEAAWYPTALLPSATVSWRAMDGVEGEHAALATFTDSSAGAGRGLSVTLQFAFDPSSGLLTDASAVGGRYRSMEAGSVRLPWRCRLWNYAERGGMQVPLEGEATWTLHEGHKTYFRGKIQDIAFD